MRFISGVITVAVAMAVMLVGPMLLIIHAPNYVPLPPDMRNRAADALAEVSGEPLGTQHLHDDDVAARRRP